MVITHRAAEKLGFEKTKEVQLKKLTLKMLQCFGMQYSIGIQGRGAGPFMLPLVADDAAAMRM
jgi:hypothetical protein